MSEEIKQDHTSGDEAVKKDVDFETLLKEKDTQIEQLKKINAGNDRKVTELFNEINNMKKIVSEKEETKKTVEQQIEELKNQLAEREKREKEKEKELVVSRIIAKHKLDPEFDFDFLNRFETEETIEEKARKRVEYYNKLKDDGYKEKVSGTAPKSGAAISSNDLQNKTDFELHQIVKNDPKMEQAVIKEIDRRIKNV